MLTRTIVTWAALVLFSAGFQPGRTHLPLHLPNSQQPVPNSDDDPFDCILRFSQAKNQGESQVGTIISLAEVYALAGKRDKAVELMNRARREAETEKPRQPPPPLIRDPDERRGALARGYLKIGAFDDALEVVRILKPPSRARHLAWIASELATTGNKQRATGLLLEALKTVTNPAEESWTLVDISSGYAELGDCEQARRIALSVSDKWPYVKAPELASLASKCAKNGSKAEAARLATEALRVTRLMNAKYLHEEKYKVLAQIASAQIDIGEKLTAVRLLDQALVSVRRIEFNMSAMEAIADAYANAGLYKKAMDVATAIRYKPSRADAFLKIARRYISTGDKANATELLDQCLTLTLDDKHGSADSRFKKLADIAIEYTNISRDDRANEVLVESLVELRREEYELTELLITIFRAYTNSKLTPDGRARQLIEKLCNGEAFELTPEEAAKERRVEEAAERFIKRWHETLDLNILFDEQYVANPEQRRMNVGLFGGVYKQLSASAYGPGVAKGVDEALLRDAFFAFWNYYYLAQEYQLALGKPDDGDFPEPPEFKRPQMPKLDQKMIRRTQVVQLMEILKPAAAVYRKYLTPDLFSAPRYSQNLRRAEDKADENEKRFRISQGFPEYDVPNNTDVYYLRKGVFEFYFIEENGKLKVLTLGFEL